MAKLTTENLFLLEFLVDEVNMEQKCDCTSAGAEMCVSFQFLDNEALDVCEGDFNPDKKFGETDNSKTGKSCLFSLTPTQAQKAMQSFDITVSVFKKMPPGWDPEKTCIGSVKVPVLALFLDLINNHDAVASAKVHQDTYNLVDSKGTNVGKIGVYIRMSCYGKMIITQFQMNMTDKSVLFKDKDGHSLYRYKKSRKGRATKIEDLSAKASPQCPPPSPPCSMPSQMMFNQNPYASPTASMQPFFGSTPSSYPLPNLNCPTQPCFPPPNLNCPMQPCFPEYGAPMQDFGMYGGQPGFGGQHSPQVTFGTRKQSRSACGGGCSRM
jgi:hypothetical protein